MSRISVLIGLPGSGKSTKAFEILAEDGNSVRVNKDDLRKMMFGAKKGKKRGDEWSYAKEDLVIKAETNLVKLLLDAHKHVIIDDTNLNHRHIARWQQIALAGKHTVKIIKMDVSVEECIARDKKRENPVGESVILGMAGQYGFIEGDKGNDTSDVPIDKHIIIVDIDGTLANIDHRLHLIKDTKNWDAFFEAMVDDTVNETVVQLMTLTYPDHAVILMSGRPNNYRWQTVEWLRRHDIHYDALLMRKAGDRRPDWVVKQELLDKYVDKSRIEVCIDDRPSIVELWRKNGLKVIDVGTGQDKFW